MDTTLLIMAAGIGSRFGGGIKQLAKVDAGGHIIMDYSIHDAIEAGFDKIVFIIRHDIEDDFKEIIGKRIEKICAEHNVKTAYSFQSVEDIPAELPEGRTKPWGTGQAVLSAKELISTPFAVINADDYYGKEAFHIIHDELVKEHSDNEFCMAGFILKNTLSENGGVTRGICKVKDGFLTDIAETKNIVKTADGAAVNGNSIDPDSFVSMNMWGLMPKFVNVLEDGFKTFFEKNVPADPLNAEYLLPVIIGELLDKGLASVKLLETQDKWFGITYAEDKDIVVKNFNELVKNGVYTYDLFDDLK